MDQFRNILVAASPGHLELPTLRTAIELAADNGADLTLVDVMVPMSRLRRFMTVEGRTVDVQAELTRHRTERLRELVDDTGARVDIDVKVMVGDPFIEVIRHVLAHGNDLVIVGGRELEPWATPEFSSAVMHLLRKCPVPVWVMRPQDSDGVRVLALVDPDAEDPVRDSLNDLVIELAASLARRAGAELHIGHAWELEGESTLRSSPFLGIEGDVVDVMVETADRVHRDQLDDLLERHALADIEPEVHLIRGSAGDVLPKLATGLGAEVIVMGTVARTGISGLIMGNTAETILRSVRCSVLAVKPEGFESPVKQARTKDT